MVDRWATRDQRVLEKQNQKFNVHTRCDSPPAAVLALMWLVNGLNFAVNGALHLSDGQTRAGAGAIALGLVLLVVGSATIASRFGRRRRATTGQLAAGR